MPTMFRQARPALAPFVSGLWYAAERLPPGREIALPTGAMQLVINLSRDGIHYYDGPALHDEHQVGGAVLCGPSTRAIGIDPADRTRSVGVAFRPGGALPFFAPPASALVDPVIALDSLWGRGADTARERMLEQSTPRGVLDTMETILLERVVGPLEPDRFLARAVRRLDHGVSVAQVADDLGVATSTFHRRFRAAIGPGPKAFGRVRRLQRVLRQVSGGDDVDWAYVAATCGYFDQAHLINDFRELTGITPGSYRPRSPDEHNHVPTTG